MENLKELQVAKFLNCCFGFDSNNTIPDLTPDEKQDLISNLKNQELNLAYIKSLSYFERKVLITDLAKDLI